MSDKRPPIEPIDYISGVKVVDIGDVRVARGMSRRPVISCGHRQLHYDSAERRIWCKDCETDVEAFDAFKMLVEQFHNAQRKLEQRAQEVKSAEDHALIAVAAKEIDKAWRRRNNVPGCPHCRAPLFPEDFKGGCKVEYGREYAEAMVRRALATKEEGDE